MFADKDGNKLSSTEAMKKIINRVKNYFLDFELMILRWVGHVPFHTVRNFSYRLAGVKVGRNSKIHMGARFYMPVGIEIGEDTIIGDHIFLDGRALLKIGSHVDIASEVMIYNSEHDLDSATFKPREEPVEIGDYVF